MTEQTHLIDKLLRKLEKDKILNNEKDIMHGPDGNIMKENKTQLIHDSITKPIKKKKTLKPPKL